MLEVDRAQVLAYRVAANGLHRDERDPAKLAVFNLGLQDNQRDSTAIALAARLDSPLTAESLVDDPRWVLAWTHRGAPHLHRREDLAAVVSALVPLNESDAMARMNWQRQHVAAAGIEATEALFVSARAIRKVVGRPMTKGAVSAAVTKLVPPGFSYWCRGCQATHILEQLMRLAAPHGGVRLEAGATPATLAPFEGRPPFSTKPNIKAATAVVANYLALHGPATAADAAGFVGTAKTAVGDMWPDDLAQVRVDGRAAFLPANRLALLENPPESNLVRLLPPMDPFLQARDKSLLVPDKALRKEVWKILGSPGVLLIDGEVAGTWRTKSSGRSRLNFAISPFRTVLPPIHDTIESEANRIAAARDFPASTVKFGESLP